MTTATTIAKPLPVPETPEGRQALYQFGRGTREYEAKPMELRLRRRAAHAGCGDCRSFVPAGGPCPGCRPGNAARPICHDAEAAWRRRVDRILAEGGR